MKYSYYPGCTLKTKAKDLDVYGRRAAEVLGITLEEIDEFQCCGGSFTSARDEIATKLSSIRALAEARDKKQDLVTLCSACHNVIKQTNHALKTDSDMAFKVNNYLNPLTYNGETKVLHYLEVLRDVVGFDKLAQSVVNPQSGKKIACYYGCLLLRPGKVMNMDNPENPRIMEDFVTAIGGTPVIYPYRNECCGGYITLEDPDQAEKNSNKVLDSAYKAQADTVITACPLCLYNLNKNGKQDLEVKYFTEILAEALGVKEGI